MPCEPMQCLSDTLNPNGPYHARGLRLADGLKLAGAVQVFTWERKAQERFARHVARGAQCIINVGYGLGFAQQVFEQSTVKTVILIEQNVSIMRMARRRLRRPATELHLGAWQDTLSKVMRPDCTLFFDAFPVTKMFGYSEREFKSYIGPFLHMLSGQRWCDCYFVAFDRKTIDFRPPPPLRVSRVLSLNLVEQYMPHEKVRRISLYRVTRRDFSIELR